MSLRVDSSSKIILGVAAVAVLAVGTVLFLRSRGNAPTSAPLDKDRFSLANVPLVRNIYNYFYPTKPVEKPVITLGSEAKRIGTIGELKNNLLKVKGQHKELDALIIYGDAALEINEDPGILALNPMKLILVGPRIVHKPFSLDRLDSNMAKAGWDSPYGSEFSSEHTTFPEIYITEVDSVQEALDAKPPISRQTSKPYRTVYSVKA
jgi:hypothetical protein